MRAGLGAEGGGDGVDDFLLRFRGRRLAGGVVGWRVEEEGALAKGEERARRIWMPLLYRCYNKGMVRGKSRGHIGQLEPEGLELSYLVGMNSCCTNVVVSLEVNKRSSSKTYTPSLGNRSQSTAKATVSMRMRVLGDM